MNQSNEDSKFHKNRNIYNSSELKYSFNKRQTNGLNIHDQTLSKFLNLYNIVFPKI